jgi:hypothetical protein
MSSKRRLSIGITINLEHYENLRLELDGEISDESDANSLVACLDGVLAQLGRNDPDTAARIDSYRRRVLYPATGPSLEEEEEMKKKKEKKEEEEVPVAEQPIIEEIRDGDLSELLYHQAVDSACVGEDADHARERPICTTGPCEIVHGEICEGAAPVARPPPEEKEEEKKEKAEYVCTECGEAISKAQEQLSQLFMGKSMCKKCMEKLQ